MESSIPLGGYLAVGLMMFIVGVVGVVIRRNPIVIFMCIELMLNAVNLTLLAFAKYGPVVASGNPTQTAMAGQMMVIFVMAVAAAEVAVGLGIIMAIYRLRNTIDVDEMSVMRG
jgi:NADH-quinone oxidoreductase subunit K